MKWRDTIKDSESKMAVHFGNTICLCDGLQGRIVPDSKIAEVKDDGGIVYSLDFDDDEMAIIYKILLETAMKQYKIPYIVQVNGKHVTFERSKA